MPEKIIRRRLPVPGARAYGRRGDTVYVVVDECYTDDEAAAYMEEVKRKLSLGDGPRPRPTRE
jgi:hypothetical protein